MKAAIVMLCRGYANPNAYERLILRNAHIAESFGNEYPLIIFHEGNIIPEHQEFIKSLTPTLNITFKDIGNEFKWPENVDKSTLVDAQHFGVGYRLMCRFACYQIWEHVAEYDYIWRIDEDTLIGHLNYDPFKYMEENNMDYLWGRPCYESHPATNETIPAVAHRLLGERWSEDDYVQDPLWVPYTNLFIARTALFLRDDVQKFLKKLTENPMFLTHRWGDHVVSGIVLKAFSSPEKISHLPDFEYFHGSHGCISKNGRAIQGILAPEEAKFFDCVPSGQGDSHYIAKEINNAG